jgi:uncharacterized pyridoxal phosphate-containing UPF0001 family protein
MEYNKVDKDRFSENYAMLCENIEKAAALAGRKSSEIELCAVTKTFGREAYECAREAGLKNIGENRAGGREQIPGRASRSQFAADRTLANQ